VLDTFRGLPVHVLLLHATVVLVPLTCVLTVAVAFWPRVRAVGVWPVVALNAVMVVMVWLTAQAGQRLAARLGGGGSGLVADHTSIGGKMIWFALALLVASVLVALLHGRGRGFQLGTGVLAAVVGVAALVWCVRVGESGAVAVWKDVVTNTTAGG
jgi:hypothetical protein